MIPFYFGMPMRTLFGTGLGYCAGYFSKQVSKKILYYGGLITVGLTVLAKLNYITINWNNIFNDFYTLAIRTGDKQSGFITYVKRLITHVVPLLGGVTTGFWYALKHC